MIRINGLLYRDELGALIERWMQDQLFPADAQRVAELVQFNAVFVRRALDAFSSDLLSAFVGGPLMQQRVNRKQELKEALSFDPPYTNERISSLIDAYRRRPELYYGETPVRATVYRTADGRFVASNRIKRVRRLAEKLARRIIDHVFELIKHQADVFADERARQLGLDRKSLLTTPDEMILEFESAETRILDLLRQRKPLPKMSEMVINDALGLKVIVEDQHRTQLMHVLETLPGLRIVEVEAHAGVYNATNVVISYCPDKDLLLRRALPPSVLQSMRQRGLDPQRCSKAFEDFVREAEPDLCIELIMANYAEAVESELGRSMHEERILSQRGQQQYRGHLATNIAYLVQFLFAFAQSGKAELYELPFKLWHRYLPDYYDYVIRELYELPSDES